MAPLVAFLRLLASAGLFLVCAACGQAEPSVDIAAPSVASGARLSDGHVPAHGKSILVNATTFELIASEDGIPVLHSRVIVGRPGNPTPQLTSSMYAIQFNPSWTPTPSMIRNEGVHYMPPGPGNPLGRILFELDNDQLIYLHDTNDRGLFSREERALSHGCIRVEQARQLAAWVLGVPLAEVDAMIARGTTFSVPLPGPISVSLVN